MCSVQHGSWVRYLWNIWIASDVFAIPENFSERELECTTIRDESKIYSAMGTGVIPLVSVDDVAAVAYRALCDDESHNTEHLILGPELLSYDQVRCHTAFILLCS